MLAVLNKVIIIFYILEQNVSGGYWNLCPRGVGSGHYVRRIAGGVGSNPTGDWIIYDVACFQTLFLLLKIDTEM